MQSITLQQSSENRSLHNEKNENSEKTVIDVSNTRHRNPYVTVSRGYWVWISIWLIEDAILLTSQLP